jgi:quercetin dioxygenase-like cupin family protein
MAGQPHPGFGLFAKAHDEFFQANTPEGWTAMPGYSGAFGKVLSGRLDAEGKSGCVTRLIRWRPGTVVPQVLTHDWCEEVYLLEGDLWIGQPDAADAKLLEPGTYACRPADAPHGPFFTKTGCLMLEFSYYAPLARP